jgi:hypothetical protein
MMQYLFSMATILSKKVLFFSIYIYVIPFETKVNN